jgi:hypothetical protein
MQAADRADEFDGGRGRWLTVFPPNAPVKRRESLLFCLTYAWF